MDDAQFAIERGWYYNADFDYFASGQLLQVQTATSRLFEHYQPKSRPREAFKVFCLSFKGIFEFFFSIFSEFSQQ